MSRRQRGDCRRLFFCAPPPRRRFAGTLPGALGVAAFSFDNSPCTLARPPRSVAKGRIMVNSFGSQARLPVADLAYTIYRLDAVAKAHPNAGPPAVLSQDPPRKPPPHRGRPGRPRRRHQGAGQLGPQGQAGQGDRLHAGPRAAAGLHRRPGRGGPGRHARRHEAHGRRPQEDQPAAAGRAGHRPFRAGGRLRQRHGLPHQRRPRVPAQPRALRVPALGPEGVPQLRRRAARHRHRPSSESGISGKGRLHRDKGEPGASRPAYRWRTRTRWSAPTRTRR